MPIFALGRKEKEKKKKVPDQRSKEEEKKKIPNQRLDESKKKKKEKFPIEDRMKTKEIYRKVFGPDNICAIQNFHKQTRKERKPRLEVVLSL